MLIDFLSLKYYFVYNLNKINNISIIDLDQI